MDADQIRARAQALADEAAIAWDGAVEAGQSDGGRGVAERAARKEALAHWEEALAAIAANDYALAIEELEAARRSGQDFGDDQWERKAIALLKQQGAGS